MNKDIEGVIELEKLEAEPEKMKLRAIKEKYVIKEQMWHVKHLLFLFLKTAKTVMYLTKVISEILILYY